LPWAQNLTRDTVAVCHIGVMRVLLAHAMGWDFNGTPPFRIKRDRLYILHIGPKDWHAEAEPERLLERPA
jgi:probable phosphoglycerate mutase